MRKRRRRFWAYLLAAAAAVFLGLAGWALVDGEITESWKSMSTDHGYYASGANRVTYTREDDPGDYWRGVGIYLFWGVLLAVVALAEYANPGPGLWRARRNEARQAALARHRRELDALTRRGEDIARRRVRAETLDPAVGAALDEAMRAVGGRLGMAGLEWRDIPDPREPERRSLYVVVPTLAELELTAAQSSLVAGMVREALRRHGYPAELLERVSVHVTSADILGADAESPRPPGPGG